MACDKILRGETSHLYMHFKNDVNSYFAVTNVTVRVFDNMGNVLGTYNASSGVRYLSTGYYVFEYTCPYDYLLPQIVFEYEGTYNYKTYGDRKMYEVEWVTND